MTGYAHVGISYYTVLVTRKRTMKILNMVGLTTIKALRQELKERDAQNARLSASLEDYKARLTEAWSKLSEYRQGIEKDDDIVDKAINELRIGLRATRCKTEATYTQLAAAETSMRLALDYLTS